MRTEAQIKDMLSRIRNVMDELDETDDAVGLEIIQEVMEWVEDENVPDSRITDYFPEESDDEDEYEDED